MPLVPDTAVAAVRGWWTPLRLLVALTLLTCAVGLGLKAPCRTHPWTHEFQYTHLCYSDVYPLYFTEGLVDGAVPYLDHPVEYPVGIGGLMGLAAAVARPAPTDLRPAVFYDVTALLMVGAAVVVVVATALTAGRGRRLDAALFAVAPALALHVSTNWDLAAVACAALALLAWARGSPVLAGLAVGVGTATKLYPALLLLPLLLLCLRTGMLRAWVRTALAASGAWLVLDVPVWLAAPAGFGRFFSLNAHRPADWDSVWYLGGYLLGRPVQVGVGGLTVGVDTLAALALLAALVGVAWLALRAPVRPRLASLAFLTVVAFLLTNKVDSPQYVLWLVPLAALSRPRWPAFLAWQATEALVLVTRFLFFVHNARPTTGAPPAVFLGAVALRDLALLAVAVLVVREVLHPELDVVRSDGLDDPAAGLLAGQPDSGRSRQPLPAAAPAPTG